MKIEQQNDKNYNKFGSKGVTHDRETGLFYNNVYPDVDRKSGLIIPKTLVKTEDRPKSQMKTSRHKRKRIESLEDVRKKLKKPRRVRKQLEDWKSQETNKEIVKEWQPKKKRAKKPSVPKPKKPNVRTPKKPSVRKAKKSSARKVKKASKNSQPKNGLIRSDRVKQKRHEFCIIQLSCVQILYFDVLCTMCIIKFFEREVLCFEELPFKKNSLYLQYSIYRSKSSFYPYYKKRGLQKTRLKICSVGNMRKSRFTNSTENGAKKNVHNYQWVCHIPVETLQD